jgi:GT2 family glycosyltransferase
VTIAAENTMDAAEIVASVIMVGFNGRRVLQRSLESLLGQEMPSGQVEVLYVDNASSDGSAEYVEVAFPSVHVISLDRNHGFYAAFNLIASGLARGRYVVALPQDALLHARWLPELVRVADGDDNILVCVTNTVPPMSPDYAVQDLRGPVATVTQASMARLGYVRVRTLPFVRAPRPTLAAAGVSGLLRRDLVERSGGFFDPGLSHYAGDVELGLRAVCVGGRVVQVPTAVVYHLGEAGRSLLDPAVLLRFAEGSRDQVLVFWKHMTTAEFVLFLPLLTVGLALKSFELRCGRFTSTLLFAASLAMAPLVVLAAFARMPQHRDSRRAMAAMRTLGRFELLRTILGGEHRLPPCTSAR